MGIDKLRSGIGNAINTVKHDVATVKAEVATVKNAVVSTVKHDAQRVGDGFQSAGQAVKKAVVDLNPMSKVSGSGASDKPNDGLFVGAGGQTLPRNTPLSKIPGVQPAGGVRNNETLIYVNGINTTKEAQSNSLQNIANATGSRTIGIHNATEGMVSDLKQCVLDKLDKGNNPAVDTLADTVYSELKAGHDIHLMAHSQGGLITSRALSHVQQRLMVEDGMSKGDAEKLMGHAKVETFGAAAAHYPDGPKYVHNINRADLVPNLFGLGEAGDKWNPLVDGGKGSKINYFNDPHLNPIASHSFDTVYLQHRAPID